MNVIKISNNTSNSCFLEEIIDAIEKLQSVVLFNPQWKQQERQQLTTIFDISANPDNQSLEIQSQQSMLDQPIWLIATGGTSGKIKFSIHTPETLQASVMAFQSFFAIDRINCFCILPLYHVSGLMQLWRSHLSSGSFYLGDYHELKRGILPDFDASDFCISLVPTQLQVLLTICPQWLAQFRLVLLGGAPPWRSLLEQARQYRIRLALTYGMTETASQVVALKPEDFLSGNNSAGQVLPHTQLSFSTEGLISITAQSLFLGYYPDLTQPKYLETDDIGYLDSQGYLYLLGRQSHKIISGGENIYPAEVEAAILSTNLVTDIAVFGVPDAYWGEAVAAVLVLQENVTLEDVQGAIATQLSRYKQPKLWQVVEQLPRNAQGKLNRTQLQKMIGKDYQSASN